MHRFLTAFLCLSTLAMTQNVVAGTPSPLGGLQGHAVTRGLAGDEAPREESSLAGVRSEVPAPGTMLLLVTGLAGLSAVGSRGRRPARIARA